MNITVAIYRLTLALLALLLRWLGRAVVSSVGRLMHDIKKNATSFLPPDNISADNRVRCKIEHGFQIEVSAMRTDRGKGLLPTASIMHIM